jgi:hypothetical protein
MMVDINEMNEEIQHVIQRIVRILLDGRHLTMDGRDYECLHARDRNYR